MSDKVAFTSLPQALQDFIHRKKINVGKMVSVGTSSSYLRTSRREKNAWMGYGSLNGVQYLFDLSAEEELPLPDVDPLDASIAVFQPDYITVHYWPSEKYDTARVQLVMEDETKARIIRIAPIKMPGQAAALLYAYTHYNPAGRKQQLERFKDKYGKDSYLVWLDWLTENGLVKLGANQGRRTVTATTYGKEIGTRLPYYYEPNGKYGPYGESSREPHPDFQLSGGTFSGLLSGGLR